MQNKSKKIISWLFLVLNFSLVTFFWYRESGHKLIASQLVGWQSLLLELSRIFALTAMMSILVQLTLIARTKFLEDAFGLNALLKAHKWFGILSISAVLAHVSLFIASLYSESIGMMFSNYTNAIFNWADLKKATLAYFMLWAIAITSALVRIKKMQYRFWYLTHLMTYSVVVLAIGHQINLGRTFLNNQPAKIYWLVIFFGTISVVLYCRFIRIYLKFNGHSFTVSSIIPNNHDTFSFNIKFKYPQKLDFKAGQFAKFIFLQRGLWHEMHPFSFSEVTKKTIRVTVKASGPYTKKIKDNLKIGTKVIIDGAYGKFTPEACRGNKKVLMIAGGVGITPILAISKKMPTKSDNIKLMYFAKTKADFIFRSEIEELYPGNNIRFYESEKGDGLCDAKAISDFAKDVQERAIYLCGPKPMMKFVKKELKKLGVRKDQIISEEFSF